MIDLRPIEKETGDGNNKEEECGPPLGAHRSCQLSDAYKQLYRLCCDSDHFREAM